MPKKKIDKLFIGALHGEKQEIKINDTDYYEYSIYHHPDEILDELAKHYDISDKDRKYFEVLW